MTSRALARFWRMYEALPPEVRRQARKSFEQFQEDPNNGALKFKQLRRYPNCWYVRISPWYRAVCKRDGDTVYWFWIGSHADFDRDFA